MGRETGEDFSRVKDSYSKLLDWAMEERIHGTTIRSWAEDCKEVLMIIICNNNNGNNH